MSDEIPTNRLEALLQLVIGGQREASMQTAEQLRLIREDIRAITAAHHEQSIKLADHDRRFEERDAALRDWGEWRRDIEREVRANVAATAACDRRHDDAQATEVLTENARHEAAAEAAKRTEKTEARLTLLERAYWGLVGILAALGFAAKIYEAVKTHP